MTLDLFKYTLILLSIILLVTIEYLAVPVIIMCYVMLLCYVLSGLTDVRIFFLLQGTAYFYVQGSRFPYRSKDQTFMDSSVFGRRNSLVFLRFVERSLQDHLRRRHKGTCRGIEVVLYQPL